MSIATMSSKLPRHGSIIRLLTDCGYAQAGTTQRVTYWGRRTIDLENLGGLKGHTQVNPWQLEASHFVTVEG